MNRWRVRVGRNRKRAARPEGRQATDRPEHRNDGAEADRRRLADRPHPLVLADQALSREFEMTTLRLHRLTFVVLAVAGLGACTQDASRSEEHTSELQSLMRISYAVFCLNKKNHYHTYLRFLLDLQNLSLTTITST